MIKVLFVIWSLERGGAERFLVSLVKDLDREKIEPVVCCLNWKGKWAQELEENNIPVIALNKTGKFDLKSFFELVRIIKRGKFDIVNTHLWGADVVGRLAAIVAGAPVIISTAQNVDVWKKWGHRLVDRMLTLRTARLIAVSEAVKEYYHRAVGIPLSKIVVIPNAIEVERFSNIGDVSSLYAEFHLSKEDFILSCVGRLTLQKGQRYLLESIRLLRPAFPFLRVLFVGDGEDSDKLKSMARGLGVEDMVRFLGQRQDVPQILGLSQALVLPSLFEGLPVCVLEAMAAGKPVVATRAGGTGEVVRDAETGFLVSAGDPKELAHAIEKIIKMPDRGQGMGAKGKQVVCDHFSIHSAARKTEELFASAKRGNR